MFYFQRKQCNPIQDGRSDDNFYLLINPILCLTSFYIYFAALLDRRSGIELDPSVMDLFEDIKRRHAHRYAAFKIANGRRIVIDDNILADPSDTVTAEEDEEQFNKMKSLLTNQEPRYILFDFARHKLALICW